MLNDFSVIIHANEPKRMFRYIGTERCKIHKVAPLVVVTLSIVDAGAGLCVKSGVRLRCG